jgi:hypothetical protein
MENYRIHFEPADREAVVAILRKYNDVIIDNISDYSVGITIEHDNHEELYRNLLYEIDQTILSLRTRGVASI